MRESCARRLGCVRASTSEVFSGDSGTRVLIVKEMRSVLYCTRYVLRCERMCVVVVVVVVLVVVCVIACCVYGAKRDAGRGIATASAASRLSSSAPIGRRG